MRYLLSKLDDIVNGPVSLNALKAIKGKEAKRRKDQAKRRKTSEMEEEIIPTTEIPRF